MIESEIVSKLDGFLRTHTRTSTVAAASWLATEMGKTGALAGDELHELCQTVRERRDAIGLPQVDIGRVRPQDSWPWGARNYPECKKEV